MTVAYYREIPPADAPVFCNPLMAGIAFRRMLNALKDGDKANACASYYDNRKRINNVDKSAGGHGNLNLGQSAVVIFSTDKAALKRSLERSNMSIDIPTGRLAVVKNNYSGLGTQIPTYATLPLLALLKTIQINGKALFTRAKSGINGKFGTDFNTDGNIVYVNPAQTGGSLFTANALRSGYYVLITQASDLAGHINEDSSRIYTLPTRKFDTKHVSTLISSSH